MPDPVIETHGLAFDFGAEPVLRAVDMRVQRGQVYGLLGRNGSGKTTLLRILLGMLEPRGGDAHVLGMDPTAKGISIRERVGYVPQDAAFDPKMTVEQTLRFVSKFYPGRWRDDREADLRKRFALPATRRVDALSGGERGRLALVVAMATDPEILVLDEPTAGLDAVVRRDFAEAVIELMSEEGRTVVLSSHLLGEVERLADTVAFLEDGQLLVQCPVEALKRDLVMLSAVLPPDAADPAVPGALRVVRHGSMLKVAAWAGDAGERDGLVEQLRAAGAQDIEDGDPSLEAIFLDLMGDGASDA